MDAGLGGTDQFRGFRAHPILRCLISSCGDTLRILFTGHLLPPSMNWCSELFLDRNSYTANAGEHLEGNWIRLGHLTWQERHTCWSCLALRSIGSICNKTFWVAFPYSVSSFIFFFSDLKIIGHGNSDNNLESLCRTMVNYNACIFISVIQ
jgi:hypothetical protein